MDGSDYSICVVDTYYDSVFKITNTTAPTITSVVASPDTPTNGSVTVTVSATDGDSGIAATGGYSFDGGATWQDGNTKSYSSNTTIASSSIKVKDVEEDASSFGLGAGGTVYPFDISLYVKDTAIRTVTTGNMWTGQRQTGSSADYGNGMFGPDDLITREQMASILYRFADYLSVLPETLNTALYYPDSGSISAWAANGALYCQTTGLISGRSSGVFDPQTNATRAEVAAIIQRFAELTVQ